MKNITKLLFMLTCLSFTFMASAQQTCGSYTYITSNAGWTSSEWYQIIDIDAGTLTDASLPKFTAANGALNAIDTDFGSGTFTTPIYTYNEVNSSYEPTSVLWPVKYKLAAFAPTMYTSAWSKMNLIGSNPSGAGANQSCTYNDNSIFQSKIFDKPGFIELSRLPATVDQPDVSRHGYIELDDLPAVERIQWSYSSTSWKRGVKADVDYHDGNGWQPVRWEASDFSSNTIGISTFSEQGYQFEEMIGKQDDPNSLISFRIHIWDGDSIHLNPLKDDGSTYTTVNSPLAQKQTVRVHQIKVFSGIVPDQAPSAVTTVKVNNINIYLSGKNIVLSEIANVEMYSIEGKRVYSGYTKNINVSDFTKGIYIIRAIDSDGKIQNKKIAI